MPSCFSQVQLFLAKFQGEAPIATFYMVDDIFQEALRQYKDTHPDEYDLEFLLDLHSMCDQ